MYFRFNNVSEKSHIIYGWEDVRYATICLGSQASGGSSLTAQNKIQRLATIGAFGVLYTILRLVPTSPIVGIPGARFSLGDFILPLFGIILGPIGALPAVIGTFLSFFLGRPLIFLGFDFLIPATNPLIAGLIATGRRLRASLIFALLMALFFMHPYTVFLVPGIGLPFIWLHAIAFFVILSPLGRMGPVFLFSDSKAKLATGIATISFAATMAQHLMGNVLFASVLGAKAIPVWATVFFVYPIERAIITAADTMIGVAVIATLGKTGMLSSLGGPLSRRNAVHT
jgi:hypothetical protein